MPRPGYKQAMTARATLFRGGWLIPVIYVLIGAFVAASHHYYSHAHKLTGLVDAVLAIVLWPLVLLGVHMNV
jgi:membrane protein YdbS with pleckstrin-like domain